MQERLVNIVDKLADMGEELENRRIRLVHDTFGTNRSKFPLSGEEMSRLSEEEQDEAIRRHWSETWEKPPTLRDRLRGKV